MRADLHTHTRFSDGALTPVELMARAKSAGLTHLAFCDHDTIAAYDSLTAADVPAGLTLVPGIEISAWFGMDVHILGLGVDVQHPRLRRTVANLVARRADRLGAMFDKLVKLGVFADLAPDAREKLRHTLTQRSDVPHVGDVPAAACRLNLVHAMIAHGVVRSISDAFTRYLGDRGPAFVGYARYDGREAVEMIREAGGVPILAHPKLYKNKWEAAIRAAADAGILGVEVHHPKHDAPARANILRVAQQLNLPFITGGSDFHTDESIHAKYFGSMHTPPEGLDALLGAMRQPAFGG